MSKNVEIWKPVVGYEGLYEVSSLGNVRSLNYRHTNTVKNLSLSRNKDGSMNSAARELKINKSGIYSCCNGYNRCKSYGGYVWRYK